MADEEEGKWKYELSDLPPLEGEGPDDHVDGGPESDDGAEGSVAGSLGHDREIRPESPDVGNTAFVLVGALLTVGIAVASIWDVPRIAGFHPLTVLLVGTLLAMVLYQVLGSESDNGA